MGCVGRPPRIGRRKTMLSVEQTGMGWVKGKEEVC
jgi:hypothetical protein